MSNPAEQPSPFSSPPEAPEPSERRSAPAPPAPGLSAEARLDPIALGHRLRDFDQYPISTLLKKADSKLYERTRAEQLHIREYAEKHVWPFAEKWDQQAGEDHNFVPWPAIQAATGYGILSSAMPKAFGGRGLSSLPIAVHTEELGAADAGIFVLFGAHELAFAALAASCRPGILNRVGSEIAEADKAGEVCMLALAHTEPTAGSDVEDVDDLKVARLGSRVDRVPGGYKLNARKVFISNGSIARYNVVTAYEDVQRPLETSMSLVVPNDAPGFSVGRVERKMGQRLCPAAEIICEDVFVPEAMTARNDDGARMIDTALSITRGPVGAMSTGIARGCLERTLKYLAQKRVDGRWLFEQQWVQLNLAEMFGAIQAGRGLYMDAAIALESWGFGKIQSSGPTNLGVPRFIRKSSFFERVLDDPRAARQMLEAYRRSVTTVDLQRCVAIASTAKFMCSDMAVRVCMKAMEILGEDANDPQWGVEKCLRDAKLAQIFEGTNQLNRLHVTRGLLSRGS